MAPALGDRAVVEAQSAERVVAAPAVGVDDAPGGDVLAHEPAERFARGVGQRGEPKPARASAASLDGDHHELLSNRVAASSAPRVDAAHEALVDLDLGAQGLALGRDHRPAQLLEHEPGSLVRVSPSWRWAAWPRSRGCGWRPGTPPRTTTEAACGSCASPSRPSPRPGDGSRRTPRGGGARAPKRARHRRPDTDSRPASARRPGSRGTPPRQRSAPGSP